MFKHILITLLQAVGFRSPAPTVQKLAAVLPTPTVPAYRNPNVRVVEYKPNPRRQKRHQWQAEMAAIGRDSSVRAYQKAMGKGKIGRRADRRAAGLA